MLLFLRLCLTGMVVGAASAKVFTKCEFAEALKVADPLITLEELNNFTCVAENGTRFDTGYVELLRQDKSVHHGIFSLSDRYWCHNEMSQEWGTEGFNICNMTCADASDANLKDDLECARIIRNERTSWDKSDPTGYSAWIAYSRYCAQIPLENYLSECNEETS